MQNEKRVLILFLLWGIGYIEWIQLQNQDVWVCVCFSTLMFPSSPPTLDIPGKQNQMEKK